MWCVKRFSSASGALFAVPVYPFCHEETRIRKKPSMVPPTLGCASGRARCAFPPLLAARACLCSACGVGGRRAHRYQWLWENAKATQRWVDLFPQVFRLMSDHRRTASGRRPRCGTLVWSFTVTQVTALLSMYAFCQKVPVDTRERLASLVLPLGSSLQRRSLASQPAYMAPVFVSRWNGLHVHLPLLGFLHPTRQWCLLCRPPSDATYTDRAMCADLP